ncbi:enterochelin esterase [Streptomyces sp. MUM 136J]|uniref:enterochelin esterase n=1 Tax=Streptomyces sp. MUM 136J TaxID=2791992 RepID=UPI001F042C07|nr:enterochelin esterase [Streptomyces sp. MUM 136J]MCH0571635.1 enterochelin esterase [Streptomyces sp. MUM 136J]
MTLPALPADPLRRPPRLPRPHPVPRLSGAAVDLPSPADEAEFWERVLRAGTPLVGPDPGGDPDHAAVTFLWRGDHTTRAVQVMPNKIGDPRSPEDNLMDRVPGTDVWHWTVRLRRDWHGTYDLLVDDADDTDDTADADNADNANNTDNAHNAKGAAAGHEGGGGTAAGRPDPGSAPYWPWLRARHRSDPFNPRRLPRRWSGSPLPYAELPDAPGASAWVPRPGTAGGTLGEHRVTSTALGTGRRVWLYEPARRGPGELPVLVLLDGDHWGPHLGVAHLLDNLIADGLIPPVAAVLPDSVDADTRYRELTCRPEYVSFLADELLPWAAEHLPLTRDPGRTVIAGQSLGGLMAAYAGLTAPHRFGHVLAQSGSFWWPAGPHAEWFADALAASARVPVRFRFAFGEQEWVALPAARRLRAALTAAGYHDAVHREFNGGHDYLCWRAELADALVAALSGSAHAAA